MPACGCSVSIAALLKGGDGMKARIATMASFAGVLVAGSAAAMVNSQVLHNAGVQKNSVQNVAPLTVDTGRATIPGTNAPDTVVVSSSVTEGTAAGTNATDVTDSSAAATVADATQPSTAVTVGGSRARYRIGDAGDVVLDTKGDRLTVVSSDGTSGWRLVGTQSTDPLNAVVTFQSATRQVVFHASLLFGVVSYSVTTYDLTNGGAPVTSVSHEPTPSSVTTTTTTIAAPVTPTVTTSPSTTVAPTTTVPDRPHRPRPGTTTTEPDRHHSGDPGAPSTTTPRWGSGNGEDD
jgi:Cu-Zn family superoxide dismutase